MKDVLSVLKVVKKVKANDDFTTQEWYKHYFRLQKTKNGYGEYVVQEYVNGKKREDGSYYTDDWEDAVGTLKHIAGRLGMKVREEQAGRVYYAVKDSIEDTNVEDTLTDEEIDKLIQEEEDAVASYEAALKVAVSQIAKDRLQHILEEEQEHIQELRNLKAQPTHDAEYASYKFEYVEHHSDRKTDEAFSVHRTKTINAESLVKASEQLPDNIDIIRVYKNNELLKSYTSNKAGSWHGSASKESLKEIKEK